MSEMFTKCNGFIVSGDPLVYADSATMTGQGTVSEPFGVKSTDLFVQEPLYTGVSGNSAYIGWNNETELWYSETFGSSDITFGSKFTLSEPTTAFEEIKIWWTRNVGSQSIVYTYPTHFWNNTYCGVYDGFMSFYAGSNYMRGNTVITSTNFIDWFVASGWQTNENSTGLSTAKGYIKPYRVVGVNRKV